MGLLAQSRHHYIMEQLRSCGRMKVVDVAKALDVTEVTIRRDLTVLQKNGVLKKTYGGAVLSGPSELQNSANYRKTRNLSAKKVIGKLAATLINDGDNIYLEAGSTCNEIIPYLSEKQGLTIIVNSINLMSRLHELTQHKIIVTGGQYRPDTMDMIGPSAEATIQQLGGFTAFTSADDISVDSGISGADISTVSFTKQILLRAAKAVFVGTRQKFDKASLYKIADVDQLNCIVTDVRPSALWLEMAMKRGIKVLFEEND